MIPHYGKRNAGALTAASPGDTLYFPFASYNDSGDSEVLTGLAVTDIEVIKNGAATVRATDSGYSLISDTGMIGDRAGLYRCSIQLFNTADDATFYAIGAWYNAFIDAVTIDGRTVRFHLGSWEIGEPRANVVQIAGDTGAANQAKNAFADGFNDTGINERFARIQSDVDTGLRLHIDDSDTGLKDTINDLDTGLRGILATIAFDVDTGLRTHINDLDTGLHDTLSDYDTGMRALIGFTDTGIRKYIDNLDTGIKDRFNKLAEDTGGVNVNSLQGDTGAVGWMKLIFAGGFSDTGLQERLARIQSDVDTGLRVHIDDSDTGLKDVIADLDTGLRDHIDNTDSGLRAFIDDIDTGLRDTLADYDSGLRDHIDNTDTGLRAQLLAQDTGKIAEAVWTWQDTGARRATAAADTGQLANAVWNSQRSAHNTVGTFGEYIDCNLSHVNEVEIDGAGTSGNPWGPA